MERDWRRNEKGFFGEFEREIEQMNELINRMMQSMGKEPQVYGFSMQVGPDGVPHFERFGNLIPLGKESDVREPFTTSFMDEKNKQFNITAEMRGIKKEEIELNATEEEVIIKANNDARKYYKFLKTPCPVDPESAAAKYNNGILEVTFSFKDMKKQDGKSIKIE